jgi:hypothetical protein
MARRLNESRREVKPGRYIWAIHAIGRMIPPPH